MGLKKAMGILVFSTQAVIGADYYFQTRDAGLHWGDLSATDYGTIVQDRFARARTAKERARRYGQDSSQPAWQKVSSSGSSLLGGGEQVASTASNAAAEQQPVCVRRGNIAEC
ncbi:hypothetical protein AB838_10475 [Rhodobacteraceae bacterium (ex Bugula neritina AB1)]|nr:hypothetical protein AB838_10475 [Rhodobacteraceae bacterium (ex Bugula neritina AB1)]